MLELALHVLDIVENSARAGATLVKISVVEDLEGDVLSIRIEDNGAGMDEETRARALDPFYTTKKVRRIGLGLPMLKDAAERAGGTFSLDSEPSKGTVVHATFRHTHIDRQPLGDMAGVIAAIMLGNPHMDIVYTHSRGGRSYELDTREIREGLGGVALNEPEVVRLVRENVRESLLEIGAGNTP
ncbi:MAG TPA: ATP-binding protein [Deltaproteobacteria bacterium]|nr:ATP-binding protein [Deltaproteobacteria bacterium]HOM29851.1 ATP-binding protein [Deltaproteobacteria bacterium]HPP80193.1 ATP-binding protein [Deltaproteobacteria bacterium]